MSLRRTRTGAGGLSVSRRPAGGLREAAAALAAAVCAAAFFDSFTSDKRTKTGIRAQKQKDQTRVSIISHSLLPDAWTLLRLLLLARLVSDSWLELSLNPLQLDWRIRAEWGRGLDSTSSVNRSRMWECDDADGCRSRAGGGASLWPARVLNDALLCCCLIGCLNWATANTTLRSFAQRRRPPWLVDGHLLSSTAYRRQNKTHTREQTEHSHLYIISGIRSHQPKHLKTPWDFKFIFQSFNNTFTFTVLSVNAHMTCS